jgi:hypothetical protein
MNKQLRKLIDGIIIIMVVVLISMIGIAGYEKVFAKNAVVSSNCCGGGNMSNNNNSNLYGKAISDNPAVTVKELQTNGKKYVGKTVKIEGTISEVCQAMGCWFNVNDGTGTMYVDLEMGKNFTIPKDSAKSHVIVEGIFNNIDGKFSVTGQGVKIGK